MSARYRRNLSTAGRSRATATVPLDAPPTADAELSHRSDRLVGSIVHRLFQRQIPEPEADDTLSALALSLVKFDELVDAVDLHQTVQNAVRLYRKLRASPDVVACLNNAQCYFEVPFSFVQVDRGERVIRGVMDCVAVDPDGSVSVLEFKTGRPRVEYAAQAAVYTEAAAALFGTDRTRVRIIYP